MKARQDPDTPNRLENSSIILSEHTFTISQDFLYLTQ